LFFQDTHATVRTTTSNANISASWSCNALQCLDGRQIIDVPADGLCFWHCIAANNLMSQWTDLSHMRKIEIAKDLIMKCEGYLDKDRIAPWFDSRKTPKIKP